MIHTPLCAKGCETEHHDVVNTLQALAPRFSSVNAAIFSPLRVTRGNNKEDFKKQVQRLLASGWKKDEDVPETSDNLKLPLLLLSSMFGKFEAVDWLINEEGFDPSQRSSWTNETALHLVARHLYVALSPSGSRLENMSVTEKVANFEKVVSLLIEKDVSLFWAKDGLSRETPLHILARHMVNAVNSSDEVDSETEDVCLSYYSKSFDVLLKLLLAEEGSRLSRRDIMNILCAKNCDGDTVMHILARDVRGGFQVLKLLVKSLGSTGFLKIKNEKNVSAMDIVNECNPLHAKDLLAVGEVDKEESIKGTSPIIAADKKKIRLYGSKSSAPESPSPMDLLQFIQTSAGNAVKLCNDPEGLNAKKAAGPDGRCAIHTKNFPGLCSSNCRNIVSAVSSLLDTHTPFCPPGCDLKHHLLTDAVFNSSVLSRTYKEESIPVTFKLCIQACFSEGWERHMDVPDPLKDLQYPLLHLIFMSGNYIAAERVIEEMSFDPYICSSQSKESPLHVAARHFPITFSERRTHGLSKVVKFKSLLDLVVRKEKRILLMADSNGETVLHVLADSITKTSGAMERSGDIHRFTKKCLMGQKDCYVRAMKLFVQKLADLEEKKELCKRLVYRALHDKNNACKTFLDILQSDSDKILVKVISIFVKEKLPFCFNNGQTDLENLQCDAACLCQVDVWPQISKSGAEASQEGGSPVQEPVSSSVSPSASVDCVAINGSLSPRGANQVLPDQSGLTRVLHTCPTPRRPQAQVRSIQQQEQVTHASPQSAFVHPAHHLPVIFIKQEPLDVEHEAQCIFAAKRLDGHLDSQNSVIQTKGVSFIPNLNAVPSLVAVGSQAAKERAPAGDAQTSTMTTSTISIQTKATVRQKKEKEATAGGGEPSQQKGAAQTPELPKEREEPRLFPATTYKMAKETLANLTDTQYKIDCLHTPLCRVSCGIQHHPLVLTLCGTSNRLNCRASHPNDWTKLQENTKINFLKCLKSHFDLGWTKDLQIPDNSEMLRYPLVHLACIFFKYTCVEMLVLLGFDTKMCSPRTKDYPLHAVLRHGYETGLKIFKSFTVNGYFERLFSKIFCLLSSGLRVFEFLSLQGDKGDTVLHVAAKMLVERPATDANKQCHAAAEIPDSTQECETSNTSQQCNEVASVCKLQKVTPKHHSRAQFYTQCMDIMLGKLYQGALKDGQLDPLLVVPVLTARNHAGETFLQILCKEHHAAADCIHAVLSTFEFPLATLIEPVKQCVPKCCWSCCIPGASDAAEEENMANYDSHVSPMISSPVKSCTQHLDKQTDEQAPKTPSESPKPSTDVQLQPESPATSSTVLSKESSPSPSQPAVPCTESLLDSVLTPVVSNPSHASLKPNTKRKIIDALKEDYSERLDAAVKGRIKVEEDIKMHRDNTSKLKEALIEKDAERRKLEVELQKLQKDMWHENQAVQALESSLEQFKSEERELEKSLFVLKEADPEPPAKRSKTEETEVQDSRL